MKQSKATTAFLLFLLMALLVLPLLWKVDVAAYNIYNGAARILPLREADQMSWYMCGMQFIIILILGFFRFQVIKVRGIEILVFSFFTISFQYLMFALGIRTMHPSCITGYYVGAIPLEELIFQSFYPLIFYLAASTPGVEIKNQTTQTGPVNSGLGVIFICFLGLYVIYLDKFITAYSAAIIALIALNKFIFSSEMRRVYLEKKNIVLVILLMAIFYVWRQGFLTGIRIELYSKGEMGLYSNRLVNLDVILIQFLIFWVVCTKFYFGINKRISSTYKKSQE